MIHHLRWRGLEEQRRINSRLCKIRHGLVDIPLGQFMNLQRDGVHFQTIYVRANYIWIFTFPSNRLWLEQNSPQMHFRLKIWTCLKKTLSKLPEMDETRDGELTIGNYTLAPAKSLSLAMAVAIWYLSMSPLTGVTEKGRKRGERTDDLGIVFHYFTQESWCTMEDNTDSSESSDALFLLVHLVLMNSHLLLRGQRIPKQHLQ